MEMAARARPITMEKLLALRHQNPPRARRRLFPEDQSTTHDNFENILQESRLRDIDNMKEKWNFDFENEKPLEGKYQWYKLNDDNWISMKPKSSGNLTDSVALIDSFEVDKFEKENQVTPRIHKADVPPVIRKRKRDEDKPTDKANDKGAKRKISFE